jgi:uncharacterized membrane protein
VLNGESKVSLRIIDWFVTNYSKEVSYTNPLNDQPFMIYDNYKSQLRAYSKKQFDPFCRRTRINFYYTPNQKIVTTVGQLNFFRWAIENGVVDYIEKNFMGIENAMKNYSKVTKDNKKMSKKKVDGQVGGTTVLQKSTKRNISKLNFLVTVCFE